MASIPFPASGPADELGVAAAHNLFALGGWNDDAQVTCNLGFVAL